MSDKTADEIRALAKERIALLKKARGSLRGYERNLREAREDDPGRFPDADYRDQCISTAAQEKASYNALAREVRRALTEVHIPSIGTLFLHGAAQSVDIVDEATLIEKWDTQVHGHATALIESAIGEWQRIETDPSLYPLPAPSPEFSEAEIEARIQPRIEAKVRAELVGRYRKWAVAVLATVGVSAIGGVGTALLYYFRTEAREEARKLDDQRRAVDTQAEAQFRAQILGLLKDADERSKADANDHEKQKDQKSEGHAGSPGQITPPPPPRSSQP